MSTPAELRPRILAAFCSGPMPSPEEREEFLGSVATSDREQLRVALAISPEVRTYHDLSFHALNVISAKGLQWLIGTYLLLAVDQPMTMEGDVGLFFRDIGRFLEPITSDLDPKSAIGQPWEWMAEDHLAWITEIMSDLTPEQKQIIAEVALYLSEQEPEPGPVTRSLATRWGQFLPQAT